MGMNHPGSCALTVLCVRMSPLLHCPSTYRIFRTKQPLQMRRRNFRGLEPHGHPPTACIMNAFALALTYHVLSRFFAHSDVRCEDYIESANGGSL
jgi:hypothetical protein